MNNPEKLVFLSDRQKGLVEEVDIVFPISPHGFCLRHLCENMSKTYKHPNLKKLLWKAARASTEKEFNAAMEEMKMLDVKCAE